MTSISVDHPPHQDLVDRVIADLSTLRFRVEDLTYHRHFPADFVKILGRRRSATAQYIRGRADRLAVHLDHPVEFLLEMKTSAGKRLAVEIEPLMHHVDAAKRGVLCLYVVRHQNHRAPTGFWAHSLPPLEAAWLPPGTADPTRYLTMVQGLGLSHAVRENIRGGSGDPFLLFEPPSAPYLDLVREILPMMKKP